MKESVIAGRVAVHVPGHPAANNRGYILRSRYRIEQKLGRYLGSDELVHHRNGDEQDDRLSNLKLKTRAGHTKEHCRRGEVGFQRKLDYDWIRELRLQGLGYKRISKATGYPRNSVADACRIMER